jgi:hypothetical protein
MVVSLDDTDKEMGRRGRRPLLRRVVGALAILTTLFAVVMAAFGIAGSTGSAGWLSLDNLAAALVTVQGVLTMLYLRSGHVPRATLTGALGLMSVGLLVLGDQLGQLRHGPDPEGWLAFLGLVLAAQGASTTLLILMTTRLVRTEGRSVIR